MSDTKKILEQDSPVSSTSGMLATLWRLILRELNATDKTDSLIARRKSKISPDNASKALSGISLLKRSNVDDTLTFKRFVHLIRNLLDVHNFDVTITLKFKNGDVRQITKNFKYDENDVEPDKD